jgi:hypothetical protein
VDCDDDDDDGDDDEDDDDDDGDNFASHGNGFMWQSKYHETYFKICQYNATDIFQFSTDILTYYFCICPHQLSMLNVLSTESLSGETTVPSRRDRHRTRYT